MKKVIIGTTEDVIFDGTYISDGLFMIHKLLKDHLAIRNAEVDRLIILGKPFRYTHSSYKIHGMGKFKHNLLRAIKRSKMKVKCHVSPYVKMTDNPGPLRICKTARHGLRYVQDRYIRMFDLFAFGKVTTGNSTYDPIVIWGNMKSFNEDPKPVVLGIIMPVRQDGHTTDWHGGSWKINIIKKR